MFSFLKLSHRHKLTEENLAQHGVIEGLTKDKEVLKKEHSKVRDEAQRYAVLLLEIFNGAQELKLLHQQRLDVIKDKKGPNAVQAANLAFAQKFDAFMDLCIKGKPPTNG